MPERHPFNSLSVIIPTHNREQVLGKVLEGYLAQSSPHLIGELLVVDDGSTDRTEAVVRNLSSRSPFPLRYLRQCNQGPAAARNFGIRQARSELLLFSDSDVIPKCDLVEQHIKSHQNNPETTTAVLGYVTWDEALKPSPFMRWYGENKLFSYREFRRQRELDFRSFYTCNLSLKTDFLRDHGQFDEEFKSAAYEDTELGYRLAEQGMKLLYNPAAIGYHHQFFSFEDACRKYHGNADATRLFFRKEAGRALLTEIQRKQSLFKHRFAEKLATSVVKAFGFMRYFLDSRLPLPGIVYRLFFWTATRETTRQAVAVVASSGSEACQETVLS